MSVHLSIDDDDVHFKFRGTLSAEQASTIIATSSSDSVFSSYTRNQLSFSSLLKFVSTERQFHIQGEIDREISKELQALKVEDARPAKVLPSVRRQKYIERSYKAVHCLFEREHIRYAKLENEYWEMLQTPFPQKFSMIEAYKKREKLLQIHLGDCQARLDEIFRRKLLSEATKDQPLSFAAPRKQTKVFKSRR
uniref:Uncharacterized protein n=1 Tax=Panagrolaimus superbus TaxID=310955 RepID=A0A914YUD0_9BILA